MEPISAVLGAASWLVGLALDKLKDDALQAWADTNRLGGLVRQLKLKLQSAQGVLNVPEGTNFDNAALAGLLRDLRELAYEAEDVLDEMDYFRIQDEVERTREAAGDDAGGLIRGSILHARHAVHDVAGKWLPCCSFSCFRPRDETDDADGVCRGWFSRKWQLDRVEMSRRMRDMVDRLQPTSAAASDILKLELQKLTARREPLTTDEKMQSRITTSFQNIERRVIGREEEKKQIIELLTNKFADRNLSVLSIWGYGGLGKTALARYVYNDEVVGKYFPVRIWISVGLQFDTLKLCSDIFEAIKDKNDKKPKNIDQLQNLILMRLKSDKFLIVFDDIWERQGDLEYQWNTLLAPFRKRQVNGNVILVTTRNPNLAKKISPTPTNRIELKGLDDEQSRNLFQECVFSDEKIEAHRDLKQIGENIVKKLRGFPLAIMTVGALLRKSFTTEHWSRVLENEEWKSQEGDQDIMPALKLSYNYLPFHLQKCFSYCALFPDDHKFDSKELVHLWIALDIIHSNSENKRMEDVGLEYLEHLVGYGFLEMVEKDKYVLHDLIHELARKVSSNECLVVDRFDHRSKKIPPSIRHLSIITRYTEHYWVDTDEKFKTELIRLKEELKVENIRTLIIIGAYDSNCAKILKDLVKEAKGLRVLKLPAIYYRFQLLLGNFGKYLHLRYLSLELELHSTIVHLPNSLSRFYHMKILDLSHWESGDFSLPRDMNHLVNLCHFLGEEQSLSRIVGVGRLKFLQELRKFNVGKDVNFKLGQLGKLPELGGTLNICNLHNVSTKEEAREAKLMEKNRLRELGLSWDSEQQKNAPNVQEVIEGLQPHSQLRALRIMGHGGRTYPTWLGGNGSFNYLAALHLKSVAWKSLPAFGQFPSLKKLYMEDIPTVSEFGITLFGQISEVTLGKLQELSLRNMPELEKWVGDNNWRHLFSGLLILIIEDCPKLIEMPFSQFSCSSAQDENTIWFPRLEKLHIEGCPQLMSLPVIPYANTLCSVYIAQVGLLYFDKLIFAKVPSKVEMTIYGKNGLGGLDEKVLAYSNLTDLQELVISNCPLPAWKHLQTLTSLKRLQMEECKVVLGEHNDAKRVLPIEDLEIGDCDVSGKELTDLLSHLPALSSLTIEYCGQIRRLAMAQEEEQQSMETAPPSATAATSSSTNQQQQQQQARRRGDLLLLPSHLSTSLRQLTIGGCEDLSLVGDLQGLRSLQSLDLWGCPNLLSSYSSCCCPFPSSLQTLSLHSMPNMDTMAPLSNLISLTALTIWSCGDLKGDQWLQPLLTHNLTQLEVIESPKFFEGWGLWATAATQEKEEEENHVSNSWRLQELKTDDAAGFLVAPICNHLSSSLSTLEFSWDGQLQCFTEKQEKAIRLLTSLEALQFFDCWSLHSLPQGLLSLHSSLRRLKVSVCRSIQSLSKQALPDSLQELEFSLCENLHSLPERLHSLPSLRRLEVTACHGIQSLSKQELPNSLRELGFDSCNNLHSLPEKLHNLPSLQRLDIISCKGIRSLPKKGLPVSLQELHLQYCSKELHEQCKKLKGIPKITIEER